jgi:type IV pilus assembly protein PilE
MNKTVRRGFSLIEMMIVLVMVGVLSAVAYPSYTAQVAKGRRADGKQALLELAQRMERFYSERGTYAGAALGSSGIYASTSPSGYYTLSIATQTADGFKITATPTGKQADDACSVLGYNNLGEQTVGSSATQTVAQCW